MLTTLAPTLALHASPLPSSLQTALDPAYPVPLRSSACYEDALLAEERARNGSTQLRCSAPVEAPPDGVRYEKATFPVFIPKCECERVMREIRAYCKAEEPLGGRMASNVNETIAREREGEGVYQSLQVKAKRRCLRLRIRGC